MIHEEAPRGLVGLTPRAPIGVVLSVGIKSPTSGAPILKDRFWFMSRNAASTEFAGSGRKYKALSRQMDPAFESWNKMARGQEKGSVFDRRVCVVRGNIVHSKIEDCVMWNRSAHRLPEPHQNPASLRPCCEGNGIWARRYAGEERGQEIFEEIPCPNEACPFAQDGKTCKVFASLLFQLRWDAADPFEAQFPRTLAMWSTRGIYSAKNLLGLFEYVLGTDAVMPRDVDGERPPDWKAGIAAEMGIPEPSLFGMPFVMQVGEKTSPGRDGREGRRFPVVSFSPDGDLMAWLVHQRQQRELAAGGERPALPACVGARDPEFLQQIRHEARVEIDPGAGELDYRGQLMQVPAGPALLSPGKCDMLRRLAAEGGDVDGSGLSLEAARICGSGTLELVPAAHEQELLRWIQSLTKPPGRGRR